MEKQLFRQCGICGSFQPEDENYYLLSLDRRTKKNEQTVFTHFQTEEIFSDTICADCNGRVIAFLANEKSRFMNTNKGE